MMKSRVTINDISTAAATQFRYFSNFIANSAASAAQAMGLASDEDVEITHLGASEATGSSEVSASQINNAKLLTLLASTNATINKIENKPAVLIIGPTGSGKSALINLLLGREAADVHATEEFSISSSVEYYEANDYEYSLCDVAKLFGSSEVTERLASQIILKKLISKLNDIKTIIMVVDLQAIMIERGKYIEDLIRVLDSLFVRPLDIRKINFCFTKIINLKTNCPYTKQELREIFSAKEAKCKEEYKILYRLMQDALDNNSTLVDLSEAQKQMTRNNVLELIDQSTRLNKSAIKIRSMTEQHTVLSEKFNDIAKRYLEYLSNRAAVTTRINEIEQLVQTNLREKQDKQSHIESIASGVLQQVTQEMQTTQDQLAEKRSEIEKNKAKAENYHISIARLTFKNTSLSVNAREECVEKIEYSESTEDASVRMGVQRTKRIEIRLSSEEAERITRYSFKMQPVATVPRGNAQEYRELAKTDREYVVEYKTPSHEYGGYVAAVYTTYNLTRACKELTLANDNLIVEKQGKLANITARNELLVAEIQALESRFTSLTTEQQTYNQEIQQLEDCRDEITRILESYQSELNIKNDKLLALNTNYQENSDQYQMLYDMHSFVETTVEQIDSFKEKYSSELRLLNQQSASSHSVGLFDPVRIQTSDLQEQAHVLGATIK